ncbi:hypothetical protein PHILAsVB114_06200 [Candidatus Planktophila limnetica]|uniref:Uncharacterized protein n=1 Tax=Candidatus Planktophila limnetica TaxID=573600 RepID=A0A249LGJ2_9ACTN|nr:hypothetical protein [Candidatus Planktophila limnetica]ASY28193.1 hypothetical protein PHILAsVB114_06200 [Candidatus Planktophila limnetica]
MSTEAPNRVAITGPGLKKQGVVVLQTLFIALFTLLELWIRSGVGIVTGVVLCLAVFGGVRLGRAGTRYVSVVTPPLAFAGTILVSVILSGGFKISQIGIDFIAALASVAPYLIISALYGWFMYFNEKAKSRPSRKSAA